VGAGSILSSSAWAQTPLDKLFHGVYAGADAGAQHVIAGAQVNGVDTLQHDTRFAATVFGGARAQIGGFVIGGDLGLSALDGDLQLSDPASDLVIDYRHGSQWHWNLTAGHAIGRRTLAFAYVSEVTRTFDVTIRTGDDSTGQDDEQGMLRFGAGVEFIVRGPLRLRATVGTSRADFGGRPTNVEIGRSAEASIGLLLQF
jgi:hypothetical protein